MHKILAKVLERVCKVAENGIIQSSDLSRGDREKLARAGLLKEIIKGWYVIVDPTKVDGETTLWYATYWNFVRIYLKKRLGDEYCLSAECSLDVWSESDYILPQLVVVTSKSSTSIVNLPFNTSILIYYDKNFSEEVVYHLGLRVMPLEVALVRATPSYYEQASLNVELLLRQVSIGKITKEILKREAVAVAGRIIFLYRSYGLDKEAQEIVGNMEAAGFAVKLPKEDICKGEVFLAQGEKVESAYSGRIRALWVKFRREVMAVFDVEPVLGEKGKGVLENLEAIYVVDAYNSLSIEGYTVTPELIERIRNGNWNPNSAEDGRERDLLAAKGYRNAFERVKESIERGVGDGNIGGIVEEDLQKWYRELFGPFVRLGLILPEHLAGYRSHAVYIKNSKHVPPRSELVVELMETYFELLKNEEDARVRAVLGHFFFVFIHPYMDGNGRLGRFIMNLFLVTGGYPWTVIEVSRRREYMEALERASVGHDIGSFTRFICSEIRGMKILK